MQKLVDAIRKKQTEKQPVLVPYIMAGDGGLEETIRRIALLEKAGVTAIEIGIPFSDPVADGPTIEKAGLRSLKEGTTLTSVMNCLRDHKGTINVPLLIMSYMNPILQMGVEQFGNSCVEAGVQSVIIPDLPFEEQGLVRSILQEKGIGITQLVTITSSDARVGVLAENSAGFLYAVTVAGTTGAKKTFTADVMHNLQRVKTISPVPVLAGFGISSADQVQEMAEVVDGVVVGSQIVTWFYEGEESELERFIAEVKSIRTALVV